jgi:phage shock protein PspC (stress-responsive transcriptional regulator)
VGCCAEGAVIRYENKKDSFQVIAGWFPNDLPELAMMLSQNLIQCHRQRQFTSSVEATGTEIKLSTIDPVSGPFALTGGGTNFPDLAVITNDQVQCSAQATNLTRMLVGETRGLICSGNASKGPRASPSAKPPPPANICSSDFFLKLMLAKGAKFSGVAGPPTCVADYAELDVAWVRTGFVLGSLVTGGILVLVYIALAFIGRLVETA